MDLRNAAVLGVGVAPTRAMTSSPNSPEAARKHLLLPVGRARGKAHIPR